MASEGAEAARELDPGIQMEGVPQREGNCVNCCS